MMKLLLRWVIVALVLLAATQFVTKTAVQGSNIVAKTAVQGGNMVANTAVAGTNLVANTATAGTNLIAMTANQTVDAVGKVTGARGDEKSDEIAANARKNKYAVVPISAAQEAEMEGGIYTFTILCLR